MFVLRALRLPAAAAVLLLCGAVPAVAQVTDVPLRPEDVRPQFFPSDIAVRETEFSPYIGVRATADLDSIPDDFRSALTFSLGADARLNRERVQGTLAARFDYRLPVTGSGDGRFSADVLGRARAEIVRDTVFFDASVFAGILNREFAAGLTVNPQDDFSDNLAQTWSVSLSPSFIEDIGDRVRVTGSYRFFYVNIDDTLGGGGGGGLTGSSGSTLSDQTGHQFNASIGTVPGTSRFTATLSGNYTIEDQDRLEQQYRAKSGTLALGYAANRDITLLGDIGYEDYRSTQQAILYTLSYLASPFGFTNVASAPDLLRTNLPGEDARTIAILDGYVLQGDPTNFRPLLPFPNFNYILQGSTLTQDIDDPALVFADYALTDAAGNITVRQFSPIPVTFGPLIGPDGQFVPDPSGARVVLYEDSGLVWNVGARFTPTPRTSLELRVGQRFDDIVVTGSLFYRPRRNLVIRGSLTDGIQTFGNILTQTIDGVPVSFAFSGRGGGAGSLGGCVLGLDPTDPSGCIEGQTQTITSGVFRNRAASLSVDFGRPELRFISIMTYSEREYLDANADTGVGTTPVDPTLGQRSDRYYRWNNTVRYRLSPRETVYGTLVLSYVDLTLRPTRQDYYVGAIGRYEADITERLRASGSLSMTQRFSDDAGDRFDMVAQGGILYFF